jgi:hypothetical protein
MACLDQRARADQSGLTHGRQNCICHHPSKPRLPRTGHGVPMHVSCHHLACPCYRTHRMGSPYRCHPHMCHVLAACHLGSRLLVLGHFHPPRTTLEQPMRASVKAHRPGGASPRNLHSIWTQRHVTLLVARTQRPVQPSHRHRLHRHSEATGPGSSSCFSPSDLGSSWPAL